ncbi:MAG: helix-turn-helix transcriptional regulator [Chitinophagaceae bacterium]
MPAIENHLPKNLHYLRKKKGLLQEEMHMHVGIQRTTWSNYENGITDPSVNDLINFSNFFGVSLDELIRFDIALRDSHIDPTQGKIKRKPYPDNETISILNDSGQDYSYILREIKKLREEINELKAKKEGRKKVTTYKKGSSKK